jgi:hypothetical protein
VIRYEPPPEKKARSERKSNRTQSKTEKTTGKISKSPAPIKRLLAQHGRCWLWEIAEGRDVRYQIEKNDLVLRFSLRYQAESRFVRLARKEPHE